MLLESLVQAKTIQGGASGAGDWGDTNMAIYTHISSNYTHLLRPLELACFVH